MTLDEAIKHCEEVAKENRELADKIGVSQYDDVDCVKCAKAHEQLAEWLKELKQLREQTRWIPVSERLPEEAECVLVYAERNAYDDKGVFRKKVIDIGWQVDGRWHIDCCNGVDGIAWMPLPEPYKAESEEA